MPKPDYKRVDLTGQTFGDWVVLRFGELNPNRVAMWLCQCKCGTERRVVGQDLRKGKSTGCGCSAKAKTGNRRRTHGKTKSPEYCAYNNMLNRCYGSGRGDFKNYGGRGITVCDAWLESFEQFYADMGPRPSARHSLDRIDNSGGYSPDNCRWATVRQQSRNTRRNKVLTYNGETMVVADWAERLGLTHAALDCRLRRGNIERALSKPKQEQYRRKTRERDKEGSA